MKAAPIYILLVGLLSPLISDAAQLGIVRPPIRIWQNEWYPNQSEWVSLDPTVTASSGSLPVLRSSSNTNDNVNVDVTRNPGVTSVGISGLDSSSYICDGPYASLGDQVTNGMNGSITLNGTKQPIVVKGGAYLLAVLCSNGTTETTGSTSAAGRTFCGSTSLDNRLIITQIESGDQLFACKKPIATGLSLAAVASSVNVSVSVVGARTAYTGTATRTFGVGTGAVFSETTYSSNSTSLERVTHTFPYSLKTPASQISVSTNSPDTKAQVLDCDTGLYVESTQSFCNTSHVVMTVTPRSWGTTTGSATVTTKYD